MIEKNNTGHKKRKGGKKIEQECREGEGSRQISSLKGDTCYQKGPQAFKGKNLLDARNPSSTKLHRRDRRAARHEQTEKRLGSKRLQSKVKKIKLGSKFPTAQENLKRAVRSWAT